jgi:P pilus assembly chaperone PapD
MNFPTGTFRKGLLAAVLMTVAIAQATAFSFSPMSVSIAAAGLNSIVTFRLINESDQPIAVIIKTMTRKADSDGTEINEPSDKDFLVFPARLSVPAKSSQNIKVQYRGNPNLKAEACYRIIAEQLPVDFTKQSSSGVDIIVRYVASLYVAPVNVKPMMILASATGAEKDGKKGLIVILKNEGTRHALLYDSLINVTQGSEPSATISGIPVSEIDGQNILALSERKFFIPWEQAVMGAAYSGSIDARIE